jgi:hypothetical protein
VRMRSIMTKNITNPYQAISWVDTGKNSFRLESRYKILIFLFGLALIGLFQNDFRVE